MAPPTVRADYDQLQQVASGFSQNEAGLQQLLSLIKQNVDILRGGDWIGQGATAFYKEMDDSVLPTMDRLVKAMDAASQQMATISTIMKNAEDAAAAALRNMSNSGAPTGSGAGSGAGSAGGSGANGASSGAGSGSSGPAAGGSSGGSTSGGAGNSGASGGAAGSASAGSAGSSAPNMTPPDTNTSTRTKVEQAVTGIGLVASTLSILEAGGAAGAAAAGGTVAAAGVGTTIGALLLPIGAFLLGASIAEQREREEQAMDLFKMKLTGGAMVDATHAAVAQLQTNGIPVRPLNEQGMAAVKELDANWKDNIHTDINRQLFQDQFVNHAHPEAAWQAHYDDWVKGMSKDLAGIYANPAMTQ